MKRIKHNSPTSLVVLYILSFLGNLSKSESAHKNISQSIQTTTHLKGDHYESESSITFGDSEDPSPSESSKVYYGIPLLYQQRQELARDLGVDPIVTMSDFLFTEHHPLFPQGFFNSHHNHDDNYHSSHEEAEVRTKRKKRGIITNKITKIKKRISDAQKKIWKIKKKAISIVKGPNKNTPKPQYESTGGSWGKLNPTISSPAGSEGWSRFHRDVYSSGSNTNRSPATYGVGYNFHGSREYGVSGPVGRHSAASSVVQIGWAKTYSPTDGRSSRTNQNYNNNYGSHNNDNDDDGFLEGIHLTYGPPTYKPEPNYKGLAVRSKVPPS